MSQSKRSAKLAMTGAKWASNKSGEIAPRDMSKLKRIAFLDHFGAESQADIILKGIPEGPARDAGQILLGKRGAPRDASLLSLVDTIRVSIEPPTRKRKKVVGS